MIHVIASICIEPGRLNDYLAVLKDFLPAVRKEKGCIAYVPAVDIDAKMPVQVVDNNVVTILEKWKGLEELHAHLGSPHMKDYRDKVKNLVESVSVKALREAD